MKSHSLTPAPDPDFTAARERMVREQLQSPDRHITDPKVLRAMAEIPRHVFVPEALRTEAYADHPLPIGHGQTISQPYIVALMTEALELRPEDRVLEVGTGCGYQAAVLSRLVRQVFTIEIVEPLARQAAATLRHLGITAVTVRAGDGHRGWPEAAPFDAILVTCAPAEVPSALVDQLREGGSLILPVGRLETGQELLLLRRHGNRMESSSLLPVRFVPMTGGADHRGDRAS